MFFFEKIVFRLGLFFLLSSISLAQTLPDLTFPSPRSVVQGLTSEAESTVNLSWTISNVSQVAAASVNVSIYLTKSDDDARIPRTGRRRFNQPGQASNSSIRLIRAITSSHFLGGILVHQETTGSLPGNSQKAFDVQVEIPRSVEPGSWKLFVVVDSQASLREADETNNILAIPLTLTQRSSGPFTLTFEGIGEGLIPADFYANLGVEIQLMTALIAENLGGTGSFCIKHNGSAQVGYAPRADGTSPDRVLVNVPDGFSDVSMAYAQSPMTQGGFHIWSDENGTGSVLSTFAFTQDSRNGNLEPCSYKHWQDTGVIEVSGKSIEFFENDQSPNGSYFLFDNITFTPSRNDVVVHNGPIMPFEGEDDGHTFGISLSQPVPSGKNLTIRLERVSPSTGGESMAVKGSSSVTFTSLNWNTQKPLTIWAPENNSDTTNQTREFRLFRSSGTSPQTVPDQLLNVTEVDDDFHLSVSVASGSNHGSVNPVLQSQAFDFNDDDWPGLTFTATEDLGYRFSEWTSTFSGENNDLIFELSGATENPCQIGQLVLDSGGGTSIGVFATFDEIGPVTVSIFHNPGGNTRVNGQIVGNNQTAEIEPLQNVLLMATPFNGFAFDRWTSLPSGVIANPNAAVTTINTSVNTDVTATFVPAPVTLTMIHSGDGLTTVNGQNVAANQALPLVAGQNIPVTATAASEWEFTGWTSDPSGLVANPTSAATSINVSTNVTLTASFNFVGTSFTVNNSGNGTTDPEGTQFLDSGDSVWINVIPTSGYKFKDWTIESGSPEIATIANDPNRFFVVVSDDTVITANFEEQTAASLVIRATNLQDPSEVFLLREPEQSFQEIVLSKQEGGPPSTFKLEFFNEGDLPLVIESVTLARNRENPLISLADSGFCLMQTRDFDPLDCQIEQPLSLEPLPDMSVANPPTLYLDFGREPGFPDLPNPDPESYSGSFAFFVSQSDIVPVFDFRGVVTGSTDVSNVSLKKIAPDPIANIANGGATVLKPVGGGAMTEILLELSNADTVNPFFIDKFKTNSNDGPGIDPEEYGFFFNSDARVTLPKEGVLEIGMNLKTKPMDANDPVVTYTAEVALGTSENYYIFQISALADGTVVKVLGRADLGDGVAAFEEILDGESQALYPVAPEEGSIYEFIVINPDPQHSLEISDLCMEAIPDREDDLERFSIEQDQTTLPGTIQPNSAEGFRVRLQGPFRQNFYKAKVIFNYRGSSGITKSFSFSVEGRIERANVSLQASLGNPLPNFDALAFEPSALGEVLSQALEIHHRGQPGEPLLAGSIDTDIGTGFSIDHPNFALQPGELHAFTVSFAGPNPGEFEGVVAISSNDPVVETFVLTLSGTVLEPGAPPSQVPNFVGRINGENISGLTVYDTAPLVEFSWDDAQTPLEIQSYQIVLQPPGGPWLYADLFSEPANSATIQTEDLEYGTSYSIHIRASDTAGVWGSFINGGSFTVEEPGPPSTVPNFVGRIGGQNINGLEIETTSPVVDFSWSPATSPLEISTYQIVLQPSGGPWLYSQMVPFPAQTHTIPTSGLVPGESYSIHIRAKDTDNVWGSFINGGSFTVAEIPPPSGVSNFVGQIGGQNIEGLTIYTPDPEIDFTWDQLTSGHEIELYHIILKATDNNAWLYSQNISFPGTTYTIPTANLVFGKSYSTHIRAKDTQGVWGPFVGGGVFNVEIPEPPSSVPQFLGRINGQNIDGLTVSITNPVVDFTWGDASSEIDIDLYHLVLQSTSGGPWLYSLHIPVPANSHSIQTSDLEFGLAYSIHIRARDSAGTWGPFINGGAFAVEPPAAPGLVPNFVGRINGQNVAGLTVNITDPSVVFSWNHATAGLPIDRYHIVLQPTDGSGWLYSDQIFHPATNHTIPTSGLVYGKSYAIHVRARDTGGTWGPFTSDAVFSVVAPVPGEVPNFVGRINGQNIDGLTIQATNPTIDFTWSPVIDPTGIGRYQIVVQPTDGGGWLYAPHIFSPATSHTLVTSGLIPGKSYSIHIRARNGLGTWGPFNTRGAFTVQ